MHKSGLLVPGLGLLCPLHARSGWELECKGVATMGWVGEGRCKDGCPQGGRVRPSPESGPDSNGEFADT